MLLRANFELHESLEIIPGFFNLTRVHNYGAAFGLMNNVDFPFKTAVLSGVAAIALSTLAVYAARLPLDQQFARFGLALIVGGAAGNLIDRIGATVKAKADVIYNSEKPGGIGSLVADLTKARQLLKYRPHTNLLDGLRKLYELDPRFTRRDDSQVERVK
jgi:hypothetical protein